MQQLVPMLQDARHVALLKRMKLVDHSFILLAIPSNINVWRAGLTDG